LRTRGPVVIGKPEQHVRKALYCGSKQQYSSPGEITLLMLIRATYIRCCSSRTFCLWWTAHSCNNSGEVATVHITDAIMNTRTRKNG